MRQIKFRGRDIITGNWAYGFYYQSKGNAIIRDENDSECIVIKKTVGQFTELLCHGDNVYEGDLLERSSSNGKGTIIGEVYFEEGQFRIKWHSKKGAWNNYLFIHIPDCEIIGNIHSKPELLK